MDSLKVSTVDEDEDEDGLDPRIQIELEKLNTATDVINKLEMQFDEANTTFRMLMNDSTRRLKASSSRLGASIVRARPYYEAVELSKRAQQECQRAAVKFQRANEIHQAAKETVALAEARFLSKQHEWQFDNAWQEMLNHATIKVTEAENQKSESGREHQKRALLFNAAEQKVQLLEQRLRRSIVKSRPYFEEKAALQSRLDAQKACISQLEAAVQRAKSDYAASLQRLEQISEEIHQRRKDKSGSATPRGPREPGVGAELEPVNLELPLSRTLPMMDSYKYDSKVQAVCVKDNLSYDFDLDSCDVRSVDSVSRATSSAVSEADDLETDPLEEDLEELKQRVRELAVRDDVSRSSESWENELTATIDKLDNALLMRECELELRESCGVGSGGGIPSDTGFFSGTSSGINSISGVSSHCDGVNHGDVVKNSSDVVNNNSSEVVNSSSSDVNISNVVNRSGNSSGDVVNKSSEVDVSDISGDVVNRSINASGDVVNQGKVVNKSSSISVDVLNQADVVNSSNSDIKISCSVIGDVVNRSSNVRDDVVNKSSEVDVSDISGDVVNRSINASGDVVNQGKVVNKSSSISVDVLNQSDVVNSSNSDIKISCSVIGDVVNRSSNVRDDVVNEAEVVDGSRSVNFDNRSSNGSDDVVNQAGVVDGSSSVDVVNRSSSLSVVNRSSNGSKDVVNQAGVVDGSSSVDVVNRIGNGSDDVVSQSEVVDGSSSLNVDVVNMSSNVSGVAGNNICSDENRSSDDVSNCSMDVNVSSNVCVDVVNQSGDVNQSRDVVNKGGDVVHRSSNVSGDVNRSHNHSDDVVNQVNES